MDPLTKPEWRAGVNQVLGSSWTPYTPTLTATTTSPGGWTCTGAYYRVGALVVAQIVAVAGASATAGSGYYRFSLPVPAAYTLGYDQNVSTSMILYDSSSGSQIYGVGYLAPAVPDLLYISYQTSLTALGLVGNSTPWTWAAGDVIRGQFMYDAASAT